jgi:phospholipid/cholesterol/gamma-HCH transport system substrate-binding protein
VTPRTLRGRTWLSTIAFLCVVALLAVTALAFVLSRPSSTRYSAMLTSAAGLYPGNQVRVLGVQVGTVTSVVPQGRLVRVNFEVNHNVQVPANAMAALVVPTVVADRFLQLAPPYGGGPVLPANAVIPEQRTAVPAEFDDLVATVQRLSSSLGPQGVNRTGALSDALHVLAQNLNGNGQLLNTTLGNTADAINTLSASRDNLAGTIDNLQSFTTNLKQNDPQVRSFIQEFAQVSAFLAGERQDLGAALRELSIALGELAKFIRDNKSELRTDVDRLAEILATVNSQRLALEQVLDGAESGLDGLANTYDAAFGGTVDTRADDLSAIICFVINQVGATLPEGMALLAVVQRLIPSFSCPASASTLQQLPTLTASPLTTPAVPMLGGLTGQPATPASPGQTAAGPSASGSGGQRSNQRRPQTLPTSQPGAPAPPTPPSLSSLLGGGR